MIYIIPGLGNKKYDLPTYIRYLHLSIDDILDLPTLPKNSVLIGFSVGAIIAYLIALQHPVKKLILCSPSPIITKYKKPKGKVYILSGDKEVPHMQKYARTLAKRIGATFIQVRSRHKLTATYAKAIVNVIRTENSPRIQT